MSEEFTYQDYESDEKFLAEYNTYQNRYAGSIRESDKVIVSMIKKHVDLNNGRKLRILDIGCSTGNLLMHLKDMVQGAEYIGGDLAESSLEACRKNKKLDGISFEALDILNLPLEEFDVIIVNAVLYMFDDKQYNEALESIKKSMKKNGIAIIYDFAHPFDHQNIVIYETSLLHPQGLRLCFRPMKTITASITDAGFNKIEFHPFKLPIDLPKPSYDSEVVSYTLKEEGGNNMCFRGTLFQPWCHMILRNT